MLEELYLNNIVIFEQVVLDFSNGLNVISGETGAGKSLVATAIGLALGARANNDLLRSGAESASVSAVFSPLQAFVKKVLDEEIGFELETSDGLIFERRLFRNKASRMLIAGKPVTSNTAQVLSDALLDIAAQNEHTKLIDPGYQRELLDKYGSIKTDLYKKVFLKSLQIFKRINSSNSDLKNHKLELERIEYKLEKILNFAPDAETDRYLEESIERISKAENIRAVAEEAEEFIYEGESAVIGRLSHIIRDSQKYADLSPKLADAVEILESASALLEEAARSYRGVSEASEFSEAELDKLIQRAEEIKSLGRVLECDNSEISLFDAIISEKEKLEKKQSELSLWEISTEELENELSALLPELLEEAEKLYKLRRKAAKKLSETISKELKTLGMENADFNVEFCRCVEEGAGIKDILQKATKEGFEEVNFMITPNIGEAPSSIAETASGGEASRAMLAIKSALASVHAPDTLIFDEIDTGVGGRLGDVLGKKLYELSRGRQVIVITHLPQIAAYADNHLQVSKSTKGDRTIAQVRKLSEDERVEEIAQMINGNAATETTRAQAREMLGMRS